MAEPTFSGVNLPEHDGARSTSLFGRSVVAQTLRAIDPVGAHAAEQETSWRTGYLPHFRRLIEAGLTSPVAARHIAQAGVEAVQSRMMWRTESGDEFRLSDLAVDAPGRELATEELHGIGQPAPRLTIPYQGRQLSGDGLHRQLEIWVTRGVVEPSVAASVRRVVDHPEWLRLDGRTLVALGAGSEIGPLPVLLRWGATVAALDLPRADIWKRILTSSDGRSGRLLVPAHTGSTDLTERAGADLLTELPTVARWINGLPGELVLGNYLYADGVVNLRLSAASDHLAQMVRGRRPETTLAFLATPTDVFAVPGEAVEASVYAYETRSAWSKVPGRGLRAISGGRLLQRAYLPGADPGLCDALVAQQGPNYALGKRLQRWRATDEHTADRQVSMNIAPPTRTKSVVKNRALAAAYAGAHRFGIEVFEPETTRALMAALLVHDLSTEQPTFEHPWQEEAHQAAHGGLWRAAFSPRSALGLAALLGYGAARP